jgi:hypothetical protein
MGFNSKVGVRGCGWPADYTATSEAFWFGPQGEGNGNVIRIMPLLAATGKQNQSATGENDR